MRKSRSLLVMTVALCATLPLSAAQASGVYLGGGIGAAKIEDDASTPAGGAFDETGTAYKFFGGYRFDVLPLVSLSAEVGYRDLGKPGSGSREYNVSGLDYGALAGLGLGPMELFARLGGVQYDVDKTLLGVRQRFDGTAPVYGVGLRFSLFGFGIRAEYEKIDVDELRNIDMISLSAFYQF